MGCVDKKLWRALRFHVESEHKLKVQGFRFGSDDLEIRCVFCDTTLVVGGPSVINLIADAIVERGGVLFKLNVADSSVRIH